MICWYCHWGWPKVIHDIYAQALEKLDGNSSPLHFGPSHVVWEDENFHFAEWCLEKFEDYKHDYSEEELSVVKWSLEELSKVPMEIRTVAEEYENAASEDWLRVRPEDYPPPEGMEMVRR